MFINVLSFMLKFSDVGTKLSDDGCRLAVDVSVPTFTSRFFISFKMIGMRIFSSVGWVDGVIDGMLLKCNDGVTLGKENG